MKLLTIPGLALGGLCALVGGAQAVGPTGPVGPVGANPGAGSSTSSTTTTVIDNPGSGTNRIEVTGNTARNIVVQCANGQAPAQAAPNVNSVNVDGRALQGRTVIITGRNTQDIDARVDCNSNSNSSGGTDGRPGAANVNSVNIR